MSENLVRPWRNLSWRRLIVAAAVAPLPPLYIGFAAIALAYSDRNLVAVYRFSIDTIPFVWCYALLFPLLYLNLVSRLRQRVGAIECVIMGGVAAFLLALAFFVASIAFRLLGPLPYMFFFPGLVLGHGDEWLTAGTILGAVLAPAGALSGWIFWRVGVAPAPSEDMAEAF